MSRWLPFKRGNDGLTARQRRAYARRYFSGPGKPPDASPLRLDEIRALRGSSEEKGDDRGN